jgi:glycosyltransferase involved in cell wall biosynthesis
MLPSLPGGLSFGGSASLYKARRRRKMPRLLVWRVTCVGIFEGAALKGKVAFISTMVDDPWGGSEELWSQTARNLVAGGFAVSASVAGWSPPHRRISDLVEVGVDIWPRPRQYPLRKRAWRRLTQPSKNDFAMDVQRFLAVTSPSLVVFSGGGPFPPIDVLEMCIVMRIRFAVIVHVNQESRWYDDRMAAQYRAILPQALRCYFVSNGNKVLSEKQLGCEIQNAALVRNPFNVDYCVSARWPSSGGPDEIFFANVARLDAASKGQDILLEALAAPAWKERGWRLTFYGDGPQRDILKRLTHRLGLSDRVSFAGFQSVDDIWTSNHVLVMPSRCEGLPLAMVEAMLYARPVVATDVGGHAEVIEDGVTGFLSDAPTIGSTRGALERCWARRADLEGIGRAGAKRIRELVPPDPVRIFTEEITNLATSA